MTRGDWPSGQAAWGPADLASADVVGAAVDAVVAWADVDGLEIVEFTVDSSVNDGAAADTADVATGVSSPSASLSLLHAATAATPIDIVTTARHEIVRISVPH